MRSADHRAPRGSPRDPRITTHSADHHTTRSPRTARIPRITTRSADHQQSARITGERARPSTRNPQIPARHTDQGASCGSARTPQITTRPASRRADPGSSRDPFHTNHAHPADHHALRRSPAIRAQHRKTRASKHARPPDPRAAYGSARVPQITMRSAIHHAAPGSPRTPRITTRPVPHEPRAFRGSPRVPRITSNPRAPQENARAQTRAIHRSPRVRRATAHPGRPAAHRRAARPVHDPQDTTRSQEHRAFRGSPAVRAPHRRTLTPGHAHRADHRAPRQISAPPADHAHSADHHASADYRQPLHDTGECANPDTCDSRFPARSHGHRASRESACVPRSAHSSRTSAHPEDRRAHRSSARSADHRAFRRTTARPADHQQSARHTGERSHPDTRIPRITARPDKISAPPADHRATFGSPRDPRITAHPADHEQSARHPGERSRPDTRTPQISTHPADQHASRRSARIPQITARPADHSGVGARPRAARVRCRSRPGRASRRTRSRPPWRRATGTPPS